MGYWLDEYLSKLPAGLSSHSEAHAKAGLLNNHIDYRQTSSAAVPIPLRELLEAPPPVSIWIPEVHWVAICMAHADEHFSGDEKAFLADEAERVEQLFHSPLYRVFFLVNSPKTLIKGTVRRWSHFHQGSTLESKILGETEVQLELQFPSYLFSELFLKMLGVSFEYLMTEAGAQEIEMSFNAFSEEKALFHFSWK